MGFNCLCCWPNWCMVNTKSTKLNSSESLKRLPRFYAKYFSSSFFSSSGTHQSHHQSGCHATGINSFLIFAFLVLRFIYASRHVISTSLSSKSACHISCSVTNQSGTCSSTRGSFSTASLHISGVLY